MNSHRPTPAKITKSSALWPLKVTMFAVLTLPSYMVIESVGATGNVPHLLALLLIVLWLVTSSFGIHNPWLWGHPGRMALVIWISASMTSYAAMFAGFSGASDTTGRAAADRWILLLLAGAGITLATTETIRSIEAFKAVVRWVVTGTFVCSVIAFVQFFLKINPMDWVASLMTGFVDNGSGIMSQTRDGFERVSGSTLHPIELAVVSSMLLPLVVWWALFDRQMSLSWRLTAPIMLFGANVITISRTGMIGMAISALIFIPHLPKTPKQWSFIIVPAGIITFFLAVPGVISTMFRSAVAGSTDSSITYRTGDYPLAWRLFIERPFFGLGPSNWLPTNVRDVFDNQYILTITTLGGVGLLALLIYFLVPTFAALVAARHAVSEEYRTLGGATAAALLVGTVSAGTFDAMSFQTFALIYSFFVGVSGFIWHSAKTQIDHSLPSELDRG